MLRVSAATTLLVMASTFSRIEALSAEPPSTARKPLVIAIAILLGSKAVTLPLRRMTFKAPGAVAATSAAVLPNVDGGGVFAAGLAVSICMELSL